MTVKQRLSLWSARILFAVTLASLGVMSFAVWHVLDAPIRVFVVAGDLTVLEQREIQRTLAARPFAGVLSTDLQAVKQRLEHLAWAREVSVRRHWPDQLIVTLSKATPVARWGDHQYVSAYGDLLSLPDEHADLPLFAVAVNNPEQAMKVYRLLDQIVARESLAINELRQNSQGEWTVTLSAGPRVLLGAEQLNTRMHRFLLIYRRVLQAQTRDALYVDTRYANGVAVRFADENQEQMVAANFSPAAVAENTFAKGN